MALAAFASGPVAAKVVEVSDRGFVVRHVAEVPADAAESWDVLLEPSQWWDSEHTWSGSAANLSIDPRAGGCFCEVLPNKESPRAAPRGSVEHMRVVFVEQGRALRMAGALGPLQADAAEGTMTVLLKPAADGKGARIQLEYIVGGYVRPSYEALAPAVDGVLGNQVKRLAGKLGGRIAETSPEQGADSGSGGEESGEAASEMIGR
ncbi:ATPase [Novosphingobium endophyticum]|uniref:ATPase n=1 Tax=Novosphingobium endophyticum TaxID=1955250 RepID=A0A916X4C4_9SPHN|nr:ATPase [Novosphingobium endophyticum]